MTLLENVGQAWFWERFYLLNDAHVGGCKHSTLIFPQAKEHSSLSVAGPPFSVKSGFRRENKRKREPVVNSSSLCFTVCTIRDLFETHCKVSVNLCKLSLHRTTVLPPDAGKQRIFAVMDNALCNETVNCGAQCPLYPQKKQSEVLSLPQTPTGNF